MTRAVGLDDAGAAAKVALAVPVDALTALVGDLAAGESLEERVFRTARTCLDRAGIGQTDIDAVVISADDVADGRSITTMLHATAAGSYWHDEIRVTNGSLTALGLAAMRVAAGLSERVLVVSWWLPTADPAAIARASLDAAYGRGLAGPERLTAGYSCGASAACLVGGDLAEPSACVLEAVAFGQADYHAWLTGTDEPAGLLGRVGARLAAQVAPFEGSGELATAPGEADWTPFEVAAGLPEGWRRRGGDGHGHATGLVQLAGIAAELRAGETAVVAATGVPPMLQAEAVSVRMGPAVA